MLFDPRAIVMFGANVLLLHLMLMVNSALAGWSLYLFILGPMIAMPALFLKHRSYFLSTVLTGLWVDAALPSPFGLFTILFLFAGAWIFHIRVRFRVEHNYHPILIAHLLNLAFICLLTLFVGREQVTVSGFWIQIVISIILSHSALLLVAPWFFNFQRMLFNVFRLETEPEEFPMV